MTARNTAPRPIRIVGPGSARSKFKGLSYSSYVEIAKFLRNGEFVIVESRRTEQLVISRVSRLNNLCLVRGYSKN
jgi:hypothetical protein